MEDNFNKEVVVAEKGTSVAGAMAIGRQAQEVQAAMVVAKKFPRDENESYKRIMRSCARVGLAEVAEYTYPRGDKQVSGPSIRLAESIAQNWGNIDYGVIEIDNSKGKSELMAYAWDLETNTRVTKVFSVTHKRHTRQGSYDLTDSRDIYELTANFGARRVRACILGIIPGDVIEGAVKACRKTIKGENKTPIEDRLKIMLNTFETEHRVTTEQVETYLGCKVKAITEQHLIKMRGIHQSIIDGMYSPKDYFERPEAAKPNVEVKDAIGEKKAKEREALRTKLKKSYPTEEDWKIDARIKEIEEAAK